MVEEYDDPDFRREPDPEIIAEIRALTQNRPEGGISSDKRTWLSHLTNQPPRYEDLLRLGELVMEASAQRYNCHCRLHCSGKDWYELAIEMEPWNPRAYIGLAYLLIDELYCDGLTEGKILSPLLGMRIDDTSTWDIGLIAKAMGKYRQGQLYWDNFFRAAAEDARELMAEAAT